MNHLSRAVAASFVSLGVLTPLPTQSADARLDTAQDFLIKAKALINASEDPGVRKPFDGHAKKAMELIDKVLREVDLAKQAADANG